MNQIPRSTLAALLQFIPAASVTSVASLGNAGGFSGARLWRVQSSESHWCLRRWPTAHPSEKQLGWIHEILFHAASQGINFLPVPSRAKDGRSFCFVEGAYWELTPWMPGAADFWSQPSDQRLTAALRGLAEFHRATGPLETHRAEQPPGVVARQQQLQQWTRLLADSSWVNRVSRDTRFANQALEILALMPAVMNQCGEALAEAAQRRCRVQPCLRDIWHDHVLFQGARLSAFIDFGAMRMDSVAVDVARLLGSLVGDDRRSWQLGLDAYQQVHRLDAEDRGLLAAIDLANTVLSGANWIRWIFLEGRQFENTDGVQGRFERILQRLRVQVTAGPALWQSKRRYT